MSDDTDHEMDAYDDEVHMLFEGSECARDSLQQLCSPTDATAPPPAERPHSPNVASQEATFREYNRIRKELAALQSEELLSRVKEMAAESFENGDLSEAAAFEVLTDRISRARAVANDSRDRLLEVGRQLVTDLER